MSNINDILYVTQDFPNQNSQVPTLRNHWAFSVKLQTEGFTFLSLTCIAKCSFKFYLFFSSKCLTTV